MLPPECQVQGANERPFLADYRLPRSTAAESPTNVPLSGRFREAVA